MSIIRFPDVPQVSMTTFDVTGIFNRDLIQSTATDLEWASGTASFAFGGTGLAYTFAGGDVSDITGGTLTSFSSSGNGQTFATIANWHVSAVRFWDILETRDTQQMLIFVLQGNDQVFGTNGGDILQGLAGRDTIFGRAGNDSIAGGVANDTLAGGVGRDTLTGGAGSDSFVFDTFPGGGNPDQITDFNVGLDHIQLDRSSFHGMGTGDHVGAVHFGLGIKATTAAQHLLYDQATGALRYDADGVGGVAAVVFANVTAGLALTVQNFDLVD